MLSSAFWLLPLQPAPAPTRLTRATPLALPYWTKRAPCTRAAMSMAGGHQVQAVLVAGPGGQVISPCGGCRQKMREFAADDVPVLAADDSGIRAQWTLGELLPASFGPAHLK